MTVAGEVLRRTLELPALGCGATHGALVEDPPAVGADVLLDLVRDSGALLERVGDHSSVFMRSAGSD